VLARATEPFFSTKPLGKGTGLGLAQVYGIARQSGGTIRIDSKPGEGTLVDLLLPVAGAAAEAGESEGGKVAEVGRGSSGSTILVVDDDHEVRAFLTTSLEDLGHQVIAVEGGAEALEQLKEATPDLVLLDFAMPGMSGAEFAQMARAQMPDLPIVFVTGYAESEQLEAALGPSAPLLRKPFTLAQLAASVDEHLPREKAAF
jgi:CheY-like chemotaxis protein